jgi:hypothetical protein
MNAIKTSYKGIKYKSRLEASIAWIIDNMRHEFKYEPQSFLLPSGIHYWPDFYVPNIHLWIEGRGYETDKGESQIQEFSRLIGEGYILPDCTIGNMPDFGIEVMPFEEINKKGIPDYMVLKYDGVIFTEYRRRFGSPDTSEGIALIKCSNCKRLCFIGSGSYQCRYCGAWEGDSHIDKMAYFENIEELKESLSQF